jgi:hypothetical protein
MIDWRRGSWTGSLNKWVRREIRQQLRDNLVARRARYGLVHRAFRRFFSIGTFGRFVSLYLIVDLAFLAVETLTVRYAPGWLPLWTASGSAPNPDIKSLVLNVSSYLVSTQVGMLGVISLALALVTLIGRSEGSSTDVQVYYHESLSFELVASCVALLAVLCAQFLWPLQFLLHRLGLGTDLMVFKLSLLWLHVGWLLLNLGAVGYFIGRFVRQLGLTDKRLSPSHSWRHRIKTSGRKYRLAQDILNAITGHAAKSDGDSYGEFPVEALFREICKIRKLQL